MSAVDFFLIAKRGKALASALLLSTLAVAVAPAIGKDAASLTQPKNPFSLSAMDPSVLAKKRNSQANVLLFVYDSDGRVIDDYRGSVVTMAPDTGLQPILMLIPEDGVGSANVPIGGYEITISPRGGGEVLTVHRTIDQQGGTAILSVLR